MVIRLSPELEHVVEQQLRSGRFRTPGDVIAEALRALPVPETPEDEAARKARQREAVERLLEYAKNNRVKLEGMTVKELIHATE